MKARSFKQLPQFSPKSKTYSQPSTAYRMPLLSCHWMSQQIQTSYAMKIPHSQNMIKRTPCRFPNNLFLSDCLTKNSYLECHMPHLSHPREILAQYSVRIMIMKVLIMQFSPVLCSTSLMYN